MVLRVIHIGTKGAEEIKFYPHGHSQGNEDRHVFVAYLADNIFLPLVPMEASGMNNGKQLLVNIKKEAEIGSAFFLIISLVGREGLFQIKCRKIFSKIIVAAFWGICVLLNGNCNFLAFVL